MSDQAPVETRRFRSPPYPAIALAKAIDRARELYAKAMHHPVGTATIADAWGYTTKSSGLWATAAALIQYGLLTDQGSGDKRKFQLSDSAIRIVRDVDPASPKRREAVQKAAMNPGIYREIWDRFGGAAGLSETVLRNYLTLDRSDEGKAPFSDGAADDVVRGFKEAMAYAGVTASQTVSDMTDEKIDSATNAHTLNEEELDDTGGAADEEVIRPVRKRREPAKAGMKEDVFTLKEGDVVIQWPERLSADSFADFEAWTTLMLRKIKREAVDAPEKPRRTTAELLGDDTDE